MTKAVIDREACQHQDEAKPRQWAQPNYPISKPPSTEPVTMPREK